MKNQKLALLALVLICLPALAEKRGTVMRGGLGFLFPDANRFVNGGQLSTNKGASVQGSYTRSEDTSSQDANASLVWANGSAGLGAGVTRSGMELNDSITSSDSLSAQGGISLEGGQVTVGAVYSNSLESGVTDEGHLSGQLNLNLSKPGQGWVLGVNAGTTMGRTTNTTSGTVGLGYAFSSGLMFEGAYQVDDLSDSKNYHRYSGSFVYSGHSWYAAGQYNKVKEDTTNPDSASGRLGVVFGKADLSAQVTQETYSGGDTTYGGTLRYTF